MVPGHGPLSDHQQWTWSALLKCFSQCYPSIMICDGPQYLERRFDRIEAARRIGAPVTILSDRLHGRCPEIRLSDWQP